MFVFIFLHKDSFQKWIGWSSCFFQSKIQHKVACVGLYCMCKHCGGTFQISEDAQSGIHFLTKRSSSRMSVNERPRTYSAGSTNSVNTQMGSTAGSLHRVASVTSVLKRIFSRSDGSQAATVDGICSIIKHKQYYNCFSFKTRYTARRPVVQY